MKVPLRFGVSVVVLLYASMHIGMNYTYASPLSYWGNTQRPPLAEQEEDALGIITDAILSPSLSAIAVVQSPKDGAARAANINAQLGLFMMYFNCDIVFPSKTIYGCDLLPSSIFVVQDRMYLEKFMRRPRNYRDRLFHYDDSVWLVFLQDDCVMNYEPHITDSHVRKRYEEFTLLGLRGDAMLNQYGLDGVFTEGRIFSLAKEYASFLVDAEGPLLPDVVKGRKSVRPYPGLSAPDLEKEMVLEKEFLEDLFGIMQILADGEGAHSEQPLSRTILGKKIALRVRARIDEGASIDHIRPEWIRRTQTASPSSETMDTIFQLGGSVTNEDGKAVSGATIFASELHSYGVGSGISDAAGRYVIKTDRSLSRRLRFVVNAKGYAPSVEFIDITRTDPASIDLLLKRGNAVRFDFSVAADMSQGKSMSEGYLHVVENENRMIVAVLTGARREFVSDQLKVFVHDIQDIVLLNEAYYRLIWSPSDEMSDGGIDLGVHKLGKESVNRFRIEKSMQGQVLKANELEELFVFPEEQQAVEAER